MMQIDRSETNASVENDHSIVCMNETLVLNCQRAIYRPQTRSLLVSDIHLGKNEVFNRSGIALPSGIDNVNLQRLSNLVNQYSPNNIIVLGDLMHAAPHANDQWPNELAKFLDAYPDINFKIVMGNHDRNYQAIDPRLIWITKSLLEPPFIYMHQPNTTQTSYVISGHLHPMFVLATKSDKLRLPAFWFKEKMAILPAFGEFTGGVNIKPNHNDNIYVVGSNHVIDVNSCPLS